MVWYKNGIRPVWYKSKDLERIKDVYRGTTVFLLISSTVSLLIGVFMF
jgi:hypothetical protein